MEFLNKFEIAGVVGVANVSTISGTKVARFSLMTEYGSTSKDGGLTIETTWFSVTAMEGGKIIGVDKIQKGAKVKVCGRVRVRRYMDASGNDRQCWDVMAQNLEIMED